MGKALPRVKAIIERLRQEGIPESTIAKWLDEAVVKVAHTYGRFEPLPEGTTCGDCRWFSRCSSLIQSLTGREKTCDFAPSRFKPKEGPNRAQ